MRLFIANRIGTGTHADPFRPEVHADDVGGRLGSIELTANRCLCVAPNASVAPSGTIDVGAFVEERLSGQRLTRIAAALDMTTAQISDMTIGEALMVYFEKVDLRSARGRWNIRVAGVDLYDAPVIGGGATDPFTYSNGALPTVSSNVWVTQTGGHTIASNAAIVAVTGANAWSRYNTAFPTDHYSQATINNLAGDGELGVITRMPNNTDVTGFYAMVDFSGFAGIYRQTAGAFAELDTATGLAQDGTLKLTSIGSVHTVTYDTGGGFVEILSATDAAHGSNAYVGIGAFVGTSGGTWDNWQGGGLAELEQEGFRFRNDDGSETTATWKAAQDTNITLPLGTPVRLRMLVNTIGDVGTFPQRIDYKKSTDSIYLPVNVGSTIAQSAPVVETTSENSVNTAATSHPITLPTGIVASDEVLILIAKGTPASTATFNTLTDWTELLDESVSLGLAIMRYTGAGVPSNPTFVSSVAIRSASIAYRISNADKTVTPQIGTTATGTSATPDPPSVTPTGGVSKPYLFIAFFNSAGEEADDDTWVNTPPTNYLPSPPLQKACGTAGTNLAGLIGAASRANTSGSAENPGTFGIDVSAAWRAQTIIVHPATPSTPPIYIPLSANITAGGEATTAQLTPPATKTTSDFTTGRMWDNENGTDTTDIVIDDYSEFEWPIQAQSPAANGDIFEFRVTNVGTAFTTYVVTPTITIGSPPNEGSVSGAVAWGAGVVDGDAPAVGPNDGTVSGAISWVGTVTGETDYRGSVSGTVSWSGTIISSSIHYPVSVSSRKLIDNNGEVYLLKAMSIWALSQEAPNSEITTVLEGLVDRGFNSVLVAPCGVNWPTDTFDPYHNDAGQDFFTGTVFQSSLGAAWSSMDHIMSEATRLKMTVVISQFLSVGSNGITGQWTSATNAQIEAFGEAIASRYAAYPNIIWHIMGDFDWGPGDPIGRRCDYYFKGIGDIEGGTRRLIVAESDADESGYSQFISAEGTDPTGYQWFRIDVNHTYRLGTGMDSGYSTILFDDSWNETGATSEALWESEPPYVYSTYYPTGNHYQQTREKNYVTFIRGGCGINFGNEALVYAGLFGGFAGDANWLDELDHFSTIEAQYCWEFIDLYMANTSWAPHNSFVDSTGTGSGETKAAAGSDGTVAIAYFPTNRTIQVDTTILTGTNPVRLRWFDPVLGTYSTITASEAQQTGRSVTLPAARGDSTRDFLLVVDLVEVSEGSVSGAVGWAGSVTGVRTPKGSVAGVVGWVGSVTGARASQGTVSGAVGWAGSVTGVRTPKADVSGAVGWAGSVTGVRTPKGSVSGAVAWGAGVVISAELGVVIGAITWGTGSVTGVREPLGAVSGAISWVGTVEGTAPSVGINDGSVNGSIAWVGSVTGTRVSKGDVSGAISWVGSVVGESPIIGIHDGSVTGSIAWVGVVTGTQLTKGNVIGAISWVGTVTGETPIIGVHEGSVIGAVTWVGLVQGPVSAIFGLIVGDIIDGPGVYNKAIDGPAVSRVVDGPDLSRVVDGPDVKIETVEGPNNNIYVIDGPETSRILDGPGHSRAITGPET